MKILKFLLLLFPIYSLHAQDLIIDPDFEGDVALYKSPSKEIIYHLKNDTEHEDFLFLEVVKENNDWFYGTIGYEISGKSYTGCIKKAEYIGLYVRNYDTPIELYTQPDFKSVTVSEISTDFSSFCPVTNINSGWVYIAVKDKNIKKEGWLQPDRQCANPYTTCN